MPESLLLRWKCRRTVSTPVQLKPPLLTPSSLTSLSYPAISGAFIVGLGFFIFSVWVFLSFFPPLRANTFSPLTFGAYEQEELSLSMTPRGNFGGSSEKIKIRQAKALTLFGGGWQHPPSAEPERQGLVPTVRQQGRTPASSCKLESAGKRGLGRCHHETEKQHFSDTQNRKRHFPAPLPA